MAKKLTTLTDNLSSKLLDSTRRLDWSKDRPIRAGEVSGFFVCGPTNDLPQIIGGSGNRHCKSVFEDLFKILGIYSSMKTVSRFRIEFDRESKTLEVFKVAKGYCFRKCFLQLSALDVTVSVDKKPAELVFPLMGGGVQVTLRLPVDSRSEQQPVQRVEVEILDFRDYLELEERDEV